jgi:hypothetical protein
MNERDQHAASFDAVLHEAAVDAMDDGETSADDRRWARSLVASVHGQLAAMRRARLPAAPPIAKAKPSRPALAAMGREALLAKLGELTRALGGAVQYAHRDLAGLSDDDLRRLVDFTEVTDLTDHGEPA